MLNAFTANGLYIFQYFFTIVRSQYVRAERINARFTNLNENELSKKLSMQIIKTVILTALHDAKHLLSSIYSQFLFLVQCIKIIFLEEITIAILFFNYPFQLS